ncbi:EAL domain-containing protein [Brevibacillus sp. GCM10020057]|uniref:bifunctional diguanylate cyclase/phosphodiesterase n=1 Tax=Brevibacillus sp. GCM10020057 TaxID=3317327 RepID=UPI00363276BF
MVHLIIELLVTTSSLAVAISAWIFSPHVLSQKRLWIGALFGSVGVLELLHAITFPGMPHFLSESSAYKATWFYMIARLTQAVGMFVFVAANEKQARPHHRWIAYSLCLAYSLIWMVIIYAPDKLLPELVVEGAGTTAVKNSLQYVAIAIQTLCLFFCIKSFCTAPALNLMLLVASVYLIVSDIIFTAYPNVYDFANLSGHLFQLAAFAFLLHALHHISVKEPFQKLKKDQEYITFMAYHDELTGLTNSRYFTEKLTEALSRNKQEKIAVLLLDIDRFSAINESLGMSFGDLVLQSVAQRIRASLPEGVVLSRMRSDEFTLFFTSPTADEEAVDACCRIQEAMKEPFQIQHLLFNLTVSVGMAVYPDDGQGTNDLIKYAQIAKNEAQREVKRFKRFHPSMDKQLLDRLVLEQDLHKALAQNEFLVVYQPQIDIQTGKVISLEALIRWDHPVRGRISPMQFIPLAEETGLIVPIGEWVLKTACAQLKQWHDMGFSSLSVSINLSMRQFFQQDLVDMIDRILKECGLAPHFLELEITESMTMNVSHAIETMRKLKELGVRIALDDFGTGYSSLLYLKEFPINRLKIDRSFVLDITTSKHDAAIISMILSIANHLEMEVIAEGVERQDQLHFLREQRCQQIQGFLFSPPLHPDQLPLELERIQQQSLS